MHQQKIIPNTITPTWITTSQSNAVATPMLSINGGWTPPKQRDGDIHIRDLPAFTQANLSAHKQCLFHQTFQALQVTTLADIADASGENICVSSFNYTAATYSPYSSPIRRTTITRAHKGVWQAVLCWLTSQTRILHSPLGQWLMAPNKMLPYYKIDRGIIHIQSPEVWHLHLQVNQSSQRLARNHIEVYHSEFEVVEPF